jgi:hypothetical protein
MMKIWHTLHDARRSDKQISKVIITLSRVIQKYTKLANFIKYLYFKKFTIFCKQTSQFY